MPGSNFLTAAATLGLLVALLRPGPVVLAADSGCDKPDHYRDPVVGTCKPCSDICEPVQDTMRSCESSCPQIYCKVVCDTTKNMTAECYGNTCKVFAYENVECHQKDSNRGNRSSGCEEADTPMFSETGIAILVAALIATAVCFFIGGILLKDKLTGILCPRTPPEVIQDTTFDPSRAELLKSPADTGTANGAPNGLPNGSVAPSATNAMV